MARAAHKILALTPGQLHEHEAEFLEIGADVPGEYWTLDHFVLELPEKWNLSFAIWSDRRPIAYAVLSRKGPNEAHLHHFMVAPEHRKAGLGATMVAEMEDRVRRLGCRWLTLKVAADNAGARRFYARHGYSRAGEDGSLSVLRKDVQHP